MNRGKKLLIGLCVAAGVAAGANVASAYMPKTTRYKITVTVDTPEGPRSGSSVLEFTTSKNLIVLPESHRYTETMRGEAVAVDLPNNQTLFALLKQDGTRSIGELIGLTLYPDGRENTPERKVGDPPVAMNRHLVIGGKELTESGLPMLVRFRDINDPKTVEKVDPDNLESAFGKGVALKFVIIEITDAPIGAILDEKLPWLVGNLDHGLDRTYGVAAKPSLAQQLSFSHFARR